MSCYSGEINLRNEEGQCWTNLAFAHSQLGNLKDAELAFHFALKDAEGTGEQQQQQHKYTNTLAL